MAVIVWHSTNNSASIHQEMSETAPSSGVSNPLTGWVVAKTAATAYSSFLAQTERATATFAATPIEPAGAVQTAAGSGDCLRTANAYNGTFAAGNWQFNFRCQAVTGGGEQDGNIGIRLWRGSDGTGASATQVTAARIAGSTVTDLNVGSGQISSATFSLGAFGVTSEYLFAELGWQISGAGNNANRDVLMSIGNSGTMLISTDFTAASQTFPVSLTGQTLGTIGFIKGVGKPLPTAQTILGGNMSRAIGKTAAAETILSAAISTLYLFILQGRAIVGSWIGGLGGFVADTAQTFNQTLAAETILTPNLNRLLMLFRTLAGTSIATVTLGKGIGKIVTATALSSATILNALVLFRSLAGEAIGTATITRLTSRLFAAAAIMTASIARAIGKNLAAESILAATMSTVYRFILQGRAIIGSWVGGLGGFVGGPVTFSRTLAAEMIHTPSMSRLLTLFRTLGAVSIGTATLNRGLNALLAAAAVGTVTITRILTHLRTLSAEAFSVVAITRLVSLFRAAVMIATANVGTLATYLRALASTALLTASLSTLSIFYRALDAVTSGAAAIIQLLSFARALATEAIAAPLMSRSMELFRTLAATQMGEAVLSATKRILITAIEGYHMASRRITSFVRGRLHRKTSMTLPHTTGTGRNSRMTRIKKRGDEDTDAD